MSEDIDLSKLSDDELKALYKETTKNVSINYNAQIATKTIANSGFGAFGNPAFQYYEVDLAEAITVTGKFINKFVEKRLDEFLNKMCGTKDISFSVAGDTDSWMLSLDRLVRKIIPDCNPREIDEKTRAKIIKVLDKFGEEEIADCLKKTAREIHRYLNAHEETLIVKREAIADTGIFCSKKHYVLSVWNNEGVQFDSADLKVMGISAIKSSTPHACRAAIKEAIPIITHGTESDLKAFVGDFRNKFMEMHPMEIACPTSVNNIENYQTKLGWRSGTPVHVKGSIIHNRLLDKMDLTKRYSYIQSGDKIKYLYLYEPNKAGSPVIAFGDKYPSEFGLDAHVDRERQFQKVFVKALSELTNVLKWNPEETSTIEDFFA